MSLPEAALFFYNDHNPQPFINFQRRYLDNVLTKFLYAKDIINDYDEWSRTGMLLKQEVVEIISCEDMDFLDFYDILTEEDAAEPIFIVKQPVDSANEREMNFFFDEYGLKKPKTAAYNDFTLIMYKNSVASALELFCNNFGSLVRQISTDTDHPEPKWTYDEDLGVFIHPRYGGTILILGKIGRKNVIFGYGASIKWDLPCCAEECLYATKSHEWGEETEEIMKKFRCPRVGIIEGELDFKKTDNREKKKRRMDPEEEQEKNIWRFLETEDDLKDFLCLRRLPEKLSSVLKN